MRLSLLESRTRGLIDTANQEFGSAGANLGANLGAPVQEEGLAVNRKHTVQG